MKVIPFDPTEYQFKVALINKDYDQVFHIIHTSNLVGQSIISYLQKKGFPEIALQFVKDPRTRFDLAIECGNIEAAHEMAVIIDQSEYYKKLGIEALRQGNLEVAEFVYQRTKNFEQLSFLYLVTGNNEKMEKMLQVAQHRNDPMSRYQNALYLGNVGEQVSILTESNQLPLAYLAAKTYELHEDADAIIQHVGLSFAPAILPNPSKLVRLDPIPGCDLNSNWPRVASKSVEAPKGMAQDIKLKAVAQVMKPVAAKSPTVASPVKSIGGWGDEDLDLDLSPSIAHSSPNNIDLGDAGGGWDIDDDLDVSIDISPAKGAAAAAPSSGASFEAIWVRNSNLAADHCAAGSFATAMQVR